MGLGNPGRKYRGTRHNVGFQVIDRLARSVPSRVPASSYLACVRPDAFVLVKPTTFMNDSGVAAHDVLQRYDLTPQDILVVVDDVHLPPGRLRMRRGGSDGGHNGLRSITRHLGTDAYPRLRIGIGGAPSGGSLIAHVLGRFEEGEVQHVERSLADAARAALDWSRIGIERTMNRVNGGAG